MDNQPNYDAEGNYIVNIECFHCGKVYNYNINDIFKNHYNKCYVICKSCNYGNIITKTLPVIVLNHIKLNNEYLMCDDCKYINKSNVDLFRYYIESLNGGSISHHAYSACEKCNTMSPRNLTKDLSDIVLSKVNTIKHTTSCCKQYYFIDNTLPHVNKWYQFREYRKFLCKKCNVETYILTCLIPDIVLKRLQYKDEHGLN